MKKHKVILPVLLVLFALAAVSGWGVVIYQYNEIKNRDDKIAELSNKADILDKKVDDLTTVDNDQVFYIKTENWEVVFPFADGVTKAKAETGTEGDGSIFIKNIVKDDKSYDVDLCGGASKYTETPFFLGKVVRWKMNGNHREGAEDPSADTTKYTKVYETKNYAYYYQFNNMNGCKASGTNELFNEGVNIARDMIYGMHVDE